MMADHQATARSALELARLRLGLSLRQVCGEVGIAYTTLYNWEALHVHPRMTARTRDELARLAQFYGVSEDDLYGWFKEAPV